MHADAFKMTITKLCLALFFLSQIQVSISSNQTTTRVEFEESRESELRRSLVYYYDPYVRPVKLASQTITVHYDSSIYQLVGFNTKDQTIQMLMFQRLYWHDEHLTWDPKDYSDIQWIRYNRLVIWTPDVLPYNDVGRHDHEKHDWTIPAQVHFSGQVKWFRPVNFETTCSLDVTNFPFDVQTCVIEIGSWQYSLSELNVSCRNHQSDLSSFVSDSLWEIKGNQIKQLWIGENDCHTSCSCLSKNYNLVLDLTVHNKKNSVFF